MSKRNNGQIKMTIAVIVTAVIIAFVGGSLMYHSFKNQKTEVKATTTNLQD